MPYKNGRGWDRVELTAISKCWKCIILITEGSECSGFGEAAVFKGELVVIRKH
jgi:hypothetical protein